MREALSHKTNRELVEGVPESTLGTPFGGNGQCSFPRPVHVAADLSVYQGVLALWDVSRSLTLEVSHIGV